MKSRIALLSLLLTGLAAASFDSSATQNPTPLVHRQRSKQLKPLTAKPAQVAVPAAVKLENSLTTKLVDEANGCRKPVLDSRFAATDERVWLWFDVTGAVTGDRVRDEWYDPEGNLYRSANWNPLPTGGTRCFWDSIFLANSSAAGRPGRWEIRVYYNDQFFFSLNFTLGTAKLEQPVVARTLGNGNQCQQPERSHVLYTTDQEVWVWFSVSQALPGDFSRIEWYEPNGSLYRTQHQGPPGITWAGNGCFWFPLRIANQLPATKPGTWSAQVFYNNASFFRVYFDITSARHNALLAFQVAGDGRFNAGAFPDIATGHGSANSYGLMFRWPNAPGTSFTTFRVEGRDLVYGKDGTLLEAPTNIDAKTNRSRWRLGELEVTQLLQLAFNSQTGREDVIRISYTVHNTGSVAQQVGGRVMIDTDINQNDGVPFRIPGEGIIRQEREFSGAAVPDSFQAFFAVTDTQRITVSTLKSGGATTPDRLVLGSWPHLADTLYDYTIDPNYDFTNDSAYAVYWTPRPLAPGETRSYTTFYGLSAVQVNLEPPLALSLAGPAALSVINNAYSPNPFDVVATVRNTGSAAVSNVQVALTLPNGLGLAGGTASVSLGQLGAGQERQVSWRVTTGARTGAGTYPYSVTLTAANVAAKTVSRSVTLPPFSVMHSLSGIVGIWDGKELWKLDGSRARLSVIASPTGDDKRTIQATINNGSYTFEGLTPGSYNVFAILNYKDEISINNRSPWPWPLNGGCSNSSLEKTTKTKVVPISVQGDSKLDLTFPAPIVMVHGYGSCYTKWYTKDNPPEKDQPDPKTTHWDNYVRDLGLISLTPNYTWHKLPSNSSWDAPVREIAQYVDANLQGLTKDIALRGRYPGWFYLSHSTGGLIGRAWVYPNENTGLIKSLKKMYLLGAPNNGAYGSILLENPATQLLAPWPDAETYPIFYYITENAIQTSFNRNYRDFRNKPVLVFAGDKDNIPLLESDGVVKVRSVYHVDAKKNVLSLPDLSSFSLSGKTFHYKHEELGSAKSLDEILVNEILPDITQLTTREAWAESVFLNADSVPHTTKQAQLLNATLAATQLHKVSSGGQLLSAGQAVINRFIVGATDTCTIGPLLMNGTATFSLRDPAGRFFSFDTLLPGLTEKTANEFGEMLLIHNPLPGQWQLQATAGTTGAVFMYLVQEHSPVAVIGAIKESQVKLGTPITLLARIDGADLPANMSARLVNAAGNMVEMLTLLDDGQHQDGRPNDGLFGATTQPLRSSGRHFAIFTAQSVFNGQACTRQTEAFVDVLPPTRLLTGPFSNRAVDADGDNRIESLRVTAQFTAPAGGSYQLAADLLDAQGFRVAHAIGQAEAAAAGPLTAQLDFNLTSVLCQQFASAFTVQNLTLTSGTELKVLDVWPEHISTQRYDGAPFNCNNGAITPLIRNLQPAALFPGGSGQLVVSGTGFANGAQVSLGAGVNISAVTWLNSELLIADVSLAVNAAPGPRDITVSNPAGRSATFMNLFRVAADQPPTVQLLLPPGQLPLRGTVTISATAADDRGIQKVEFYLNGQLAAADTDFPYQFVWQTMSAANGDHTLAARAYDTLGQVQETQRTVTVNNVTVVTVSAASFSAERMASESIVAAFGVGLATTVQVATALPLPTTLAGTTVSVKDSAGRERLAPLFFVSPGQVNYLIPAGLAAGSATVTVTSGSGAVSSGLIRLETVAPGLFSANANGQGVAAAVALRVKANGQQFFEPVARADGTGRNVALPLDFGEPGDQLYLLLFGTGLRGHSGLAQVTAKLGGVDAPVLFAGAQGSLAGLDQVNLTLPRVLAGRGEVDVVLTVDGQPANIVKIAFK
jgi:uncharacterized protein (TIGR03437 family)